MGAEIVPTLVTEKPKGKLFTAVLPSVWFIKLRSNRRRSRNSRASDENSEPVIPDNAPFLPKSVENCYRTALASEACSFSPLDGSHSRSPSDPPISSPCAERDGVKSAPVPSTPNRKSIARSEGTLSTKSIARSEETPTRKSMSRSEGSAGTTRSTTVTSVATTTSSTNSSIFSRCMYRSTLFSGLRSLCKLVDDDDSLLKGSNSIQFRKSPTPTMRAWFLVGCGGTPRSRTRHSSLDLERESGLMELDGESGLGCIEEGVGVEASWPRKSESWSAGDSMKHNNGEVVKNEVVVKKKNSSKHRVQSPVKSPMKVRSPAKLKQGTKPTLGHLFSSKSDTDSPRKDFPETEEESEIHIEDPKLVTLPWGSTSFGSDSTFRVPSVCSEYGLALSERRPFSCDDSEIPAYNDEVDTGNLSDSQSLLRAKMLAAEQSCDGSKSWRDLRKFDLKQKDDAAMKLLASLDHALDQRNLKRLIEDDEDSDPGYESIFGSPRFEFHNSPVFESFLESSAKAWGIDFPSLKMDEAKTSGNISDKSRELHCVTVQTATQMEKARELAHEWDSKGREGNSAVRVSSSLCAKPRKTKRSGEKEDPKRPSPSRKAPSKILHQSPPGGDVPKNSRDQRTMHPQREVMVDPGLHEEFHHRRKFNEPRKRTKQRRSKQVASVDTSPPAPIPAPASAPAPATKQQTSVTKERVAVVVESSYDPYNDFRESMIEMIVDQDIQETGDLEELLQCYLSLNEAEYHNVIVDVFTDVWHELFENKF
ncbi:uncharacterized protein [Physcomitrium patens]|uniref:OVATE domain-containing protein n=1 Tax=Physcomitrium patens TaxID=3218 RepID=A0A2K1JIR4_PHYPA|nr:uncharacterized protein LOC112291403 [Physcomitrium patens]XP_024394521.1 uncharacterized protein LOC112291403 [Physcomitrium patens]XP_024394522.1 uncharacterized protein LOC112291403 [Physcomitrium patens]XP_024394523.1 uncharacterized protein LOC112291403 [Physcomitrium patens]XP_024394524.1 uncharacterized protein LOC112291403 [Physcomitrium patens]PNR41444.1 hypothetical protein PHYPA_018847 [Physcomitrium patens]|eukprot:XP_024394520.1 uncharacterized protein LOC112291403 [Physcomitrella patens]